MITAAEHPSASYKQYSPNGYPGGAATSVLMVCNTHPDEVASQEMLQLLQERSAANELPPGVDYVIGNVAAHIAGRRRHLKHNLYRVFPGDANSLDPEVRRAAELCALAARYDVVIDVHGYDPKTIYTALTWPPLLGVNPAANARTLSIAGHLSGVAYPDLAGGRMMAAAPRHFAGVCRNVIMIELTPGDSIFSPSTLIDEVETITQGATYSLRGLQWYQHAGSVTLEAVVRAGIKGQHLPFEEIPPRSAERLGLPRGSAFLCCSREPALDSDGRLYAGEAMIPLGKGVRPPTHVSQRL